MNNEKTSSPPPLKKAFTLSEVLITLVIIGVVAAITVPVMVANHQKEALRVQFTKTYSDLNNFSRKFYADEGISFTEYTRKNRTPSVFFATFLSYFNTGGTASNDVWNTAAEDRDSNYTLKTMRNTKAPGYGCDNTAFKADLSGRLYKFNDAPLTDDVNGPVICIDTNGLKGPNKLGYDYFLFVFTIDGRVIPMGMEDENNIEAGYNNGQNYVFLGPENCNRQSSNYRQNMSCAYYALIDKNPNNENKSYWKDFI